MQHLLDSLVTSVVAFIGSGTGGAAYQYGRWLTDKWEGR